MDTRQQFEAWIGSPPFEHMLDRYPLNDPSVPWLGQYKRYETQIAWEAWQAATKDEREACVQLCDEVSGPLFDQFGRGARNCAAAIRAREQGEGTEL